MGMLCMPASDSPQHLPSAPTDVLPSLWAGTELPQEFPPGMFVGVRGLQEEIHFSYMGALLGLRVPQDDGPAKYPLECQTDRDYRKDAAGQDIYQKRKN